MGKFAFFGGGVKSALASYLLHAQSVSITAGGTYTPADTALYCVVGDSYDAIGTGLFVEIYDGTAWRRVTGDFRYGKTFCEDGNVRLYSDYARTLYLITKKKPVTVSRVAGTVPAGGTFVLPAGWMAVAFWGVGTGLFEIYDGTTWRNVLCPPSFVSDGANARIKEGSETDPISYVYVKGDDSVA